MPLFEDLSQQPGLIENVVESVIKLDGTSLQQICMTCGSLLSCVPDKSENKIDVNMVLSEISTLKQFFTDDELKSFLAWLGLVYDEKNNHLVTIIEKSLMELRMAEFVNYIRSKLPSSKESCETPESVKKTTNKALITVEASARTLIAEGSVTISNYNGKLALMMGDGKLWHSKKIERFLQKYSLGTFVRVYKDKNGFRIRSFGS